MQDNKPHARTCGAKTRSGSPCKSKSVMPNGRCRMHGGKTPGGIASPNLKTGRYSKYLPVRMADKYHEARSDPDLLVLRDDLSLVESRIEDLIKRVDTGEAGENWNRARSALGDLSKAVHEQNAAAMLVAITSLENVIKKGQADYLTWGEISVMIEQRRRLVESERKRLVEMQQTITYERAALMFAVITEAIRRNVTDQHARAAIAEELRTLWFTNKPAVIDNG